ncbi:MAG: hypothetical protein QXJ17_04535 [Nitrososphaeria archaeon]
MKAKSLEKKVVQVQAQAEEEKTRYLVALDFSKEIVECDYVAVDYPKPDWVMLVNLQLDGENMSHLMVPVQRVLYMHKRKVE